MPLLGTKEILGTEVEVHADKYGTFRINDGDKVIGSGDTLDAAVTKARQELNKRKVKVEVHFMTRDGKRGVATGFHGRNHTVLTRVGGEAQAFEPTSARRMFPPDMPKAKIQRYLTLKEQEKQIRADINAIDREFEFDLWSATTKAIDAAVAAKAKPLARAR
jgi:hypothetical protein